MDDIICIESYDGIDDVDAVISLVSSQMGVIGGNADRERVRNALENALKPQSRARLFLVKSGAVPTAFAFGNVCSGLESGGDYLWLNELFVDERYRRRGIAVRLTGFIERWCVERRIRYIACITGKTNEGAQSFYKAGGFSLDGVVWVDKELK